MKKTFALTCLAGLASKSLAVSCGTFKLKGFNKELLAEVQDPDDWHHFHEDWRNGVYVHRPLGYSNDYYDYYDGDEGQLGYAIGG